MRAKRDSITLTTAHYWRNIIVAAKAVSADYAPAGVDANALAVGGGEPRQREIVQIDEAVEEIAGRIELDRQPPFREVDLNFVRAFLQAAAHFGFVFAQQVLDELESVGRTDIPLFRD